MEAGPATKPQTRLFVGTQSSGPDGGIFVAWLDEATGRLSALRQVADVERPTWPLADPRRPILYSVSEIGNGGDREGRVLSFAIEAGGGLSEISRAGSGGGGATHLTLAADGHAIFAANFGGGQVAVFPVGDDGTIAPLSSIRQQIGTGPHRRQQSAHPHGVTLDPSQLYLLAPDMGADRVFVYRYDAATGALSDADPATEQTPAGSGPRLILFGRDGRFAYLLTELSAELFVYRWEAGHLTRIGRTPLDSPEAEGERSAAAITLSADGRFLYASNRRTAEMLVYAVDPESGLLSEVQRIAAGGVRPWGAEISPSGRWMVVANQGSDLLTVFAVDPDVGTLTRVEGGLKVPVPTGIAFA